MLYLFMDISFTNSHNCMIYIKIYKNGPSWKIPQSNLSMIICIQIISMRHLFGFSNHNKFLNPSSVKYRTDNVKNSFLPMTNINNKNVITGLVILSENKNRVERCTPVEYTYFANGFLFSLSHVSFILILEYSRYKSIDAKLITPQTSQCTELEIILFCISLNVHHIKKSFI